MNQGDFLQDPMIQKILATLPKWRAIYADMSQQSNETREVVSANQDKHPDAAARLICLFDERIKMYTEMIQIVDRMQLLLFTAGALSEDPVNEMRTMMKKLLDGHKVMSAMVEQSLEITAEVASLRSAQPPN